MSKIQEGKFQAISTMRVLAMLMIIAFHSMLFYTGKWWRFNGPYIILWKKFSEFLNTIDLPMFVFISGFLFAHLYINKSKYHDRTQFVLEKVRRLLIPYLFWGIFLVITMPSLNQWSELLTGISHLWFLLMLFIIFTIIPWMARFLCMEASTVMWVCVFIGSFLLFGAYHVFNTHHYFLCLHTVFFYFPAFLLGMCFARFRLHNHISSKYASILLIIATVILTFFIIQSPPLAYFIDYAFLLITGYTIIVCIFVLLNKKYNFGKKTTAIIAHIDKLSMGIYIFNQIIINAFLFIPNARILLKEHYYIGVFIIFVVGLFIPYLLSLFFNRFKFLKWTIGQTCVNAF